MKDFRDRRKGNKEVTLAKGRWIVAKVTSFRGWHVVHWADYLTGADQVIPD